MKEVDVGSSRAFVRISRAWMSLVFAMKLFCVIDDRLDKMICNRWDFKYESLRCSEMTCLLFLKRFLV